MRRGSIFNGTRSWLLYNVCFPAIIYAKKGWIGHFEFEISLNLISNPKKKCVVLSWASFWMKLSIAPARVGLGITTYLSIKTLANSFQDGMPRVAYLKVNYMYSWVRISENHFFLGFHVLLGLRHLDDRVWHIHLHRFSWIYNSAIPATQKSTQPQMQRMFLQ